MARWMIRGGRDDVFFRACREYGVAIIGFHPVQSVAGVASREALRERVEAAYSERSPAVITRWTDEMWAFVHDIQAGDEIIMPYQSGKRFLIGEWLGTPYQYRADLCSNGHHVRGVRWFADVERTSLGDSLWAQLSDRRTIKRLDLQFIAGLGDTSSVTRSETDVMIFDTTSLEGERWSREQAVLSRSAAIVKQAWLANIAMNGGSGKCEVCGFASTDRGMFDVHHLYPVSLGVRQTTRKELAVLCPRCHRQAHRKPGAAPYTLDELRTIGLSGLPA